MCGPTDVCQAPRHTEEPALSLFSCLERSFQFTLLPPELPWASVSRRQVGGPSLPVRTSELRIPQKTEPALLASVHVPRVSPAQPSLKQNLLEQPLPFTPLTGKVASLPLSL